MKDRIISPDWQQILDRIDAHGESQKPDAPPAPIAFRFWLAVWGVGVAALYGLGVVLGMLQ